MRDRFDSAWILFRQGRWGLAEKELARHLEDYPDHAHSHALLALCLVERQAYQQAIEKARVAIRLAPDEPFAHYALSRACLKCRRFGEAEAAIHEALRLNPTDPLYCLHWAQILRSRLQFAEALAAVEQALQIDPMDADCLSFRADLLLCMGQTGEATASMAAGLASEPENAIGHSVRGWLLLQQGATTDALAAFHEALRLRPDLEDARRGLVEALKGRNPAYRSLLQFQFWLRRWLLTRNSRIAVFAIASVTYLVLASIPATKPLAEIALYILLALMLAPAVSTLCLRCSRTGRLALSPDEVAVSNAVAGCAVLALIALGRRALLDDAEGRLVGLTWICMTIPWSLVYDQPSGRFRRIQFGYAILLSAWTAVPLVRLLAGEPSPEWMYNVVAVGIFVAMALGSWLKRLPLPD